MAQLVEGDEVPSEYSALVQPHVDSYDYFVNEGMQLAVESMEPLEVRNSQRRAAEAAARAAGSGQTAMRNLLQQQGSFRASAPPHAWHSKGFYCATPRLCHAMLMDNCMNTWQH